MRAATVVVSAFVGLSSAANFVGFPARLRCTVTATETVDITKAEAEARIVGQNGKPAGPQISVDASSTGFFPCRNLKGVPLYGVEFIEAYAYDAKSDTYTFCGASGLFMDTPTGYPDACQELN